MALAKAGEITDFKVTVEPEELLALSTATFSFTRIESPNYEGDGKIVLKMPALRGLVDVEYPFSNDDFICETTSLVGAAGSVVEDADGNKIYEITYDELVDDAEVPIVITCSNFRNPVVPGEMRGYQLMTYYDDTELLDTSNEFTLNSTSFNPA